MIDDQIRSSRVFGCTSVPDWRTIFENILRQGGRQVFVVFFFREIESITNSWLLLQ
jgi:hypothetical protein